MSLTDIGRGEAQAPPVDRTGHGSGALTAGVRALFAAVSGLLLTAGIGVVLWAVTPTSIGGPQQFLRAAVAAFAAGNTMTLTIGRAALTLHPLMITVIAVALLAGISGRGRTAADDRTGELTRTAAAAAVYAAVVTTAGVVLGSPGAVAAEQWWRPFLLALAVVGTSVFFRGQAWRSLLLARTPLWFPVAARLGAAGAAGVLAAGAGALVIGLGGSFGDSSTVQTLAAPGPAAGFGMVLLNVAYFPNAVLAGAGYATAAGFNIGAGSYSPFGSFPVELPGVSLLAAAPDGREASRVGMVLLLLPVVVAFLVGRTATRRLDSRRDRLQAVGTGAAIAGLVVAMLAVVGGGGVTGGQWSTIGAPPLLLGVFTAVILAVVGGAVAGTARQSAVEASTQTAAPEPGPAEDLDAAADEKSDEPAAGPATEAEPGAGADAEPVAVADAAPSAADPADTRPTAGADAAPPATDPADSGPTAGEPSTADAKPAAEPTVADPAASAELAVPGAAHQHTDDQAESDVENQPTAGPRPAE